VKIAATTGSLYHRKTFLTPLLGSLYGVPFARVAKRCAEAGSV